MCFNVSQRFVKEKDGYKLTLEELFSIVVFLMNQSFGLHLEESF